MKKLFLAIALYLSILSANYAQAVIVENQTLVTVTLTDFVYIDGACQAPTPNFYGINEPEPPGINPSAAFHISRGWKLNFSDGLGNNAVLRGETPAGCTTTNILTNTLGTLNLKATYDPNGDLHIYVY